MERLICVAIGYAFGLIQSGYLYGRINHIDIRSMGAAMPVPLMCCALWEQRLVR